MHHIRKNHKIIFEKKKNMKLLWIEGTLGIVCVEVTIHNIIKKGVIYYKSNYLYIFIISKFPDDISNAIL